MKTENNAPEAELLLERKAGSQQAEPLLEEESRISGGHPLRLVGRVALGMGMVASLVGIAALSRLRLPQSTSAELKVPFRLYRAEVDQDLLPMPGSATQYDGLEDKRAIEVVADKDGNTHVFGIGDWGGTLPDHQTFGSNQGWDMYEQLSLAEIMKARAATHDPQYVLNVGDNFYIGGLDIPCQSPPDAVYGGGEAAFTSGWQAIYAELANKPWISCLGNHDYGGWRMDNGWPQQIGYSFVNYNWIMPARYYTKKVQHPGYTVEYFVYDSNANDAKETGDPDSDHNICGQHNFGGQGSCGNNGGMPSIEECSTWFWGSHFAQKEWLDQKLGESTADWKIVVTHFPCGYDADFWKEMKAKHGVDLLVTGHRHQQELWRQDSDNAYIQSFMVSSGWDGSAPACFVTGGGGGIKSEAFGYAEYGMDLQVYGFFHLTMNKNWMGINLINMNGDECGNWTIYPHGSHGYEEQQNMSYDMSKAHCADFCGDGNNNYNAEVCGWQSCAGCGGCHPDL